MSENGKTRLTPHETRILRLILAGKSNREISLELHLKERSTSIYVSTIYRKLELENPRQIIPRLKELLAIADL